MTNEKRIELEQRIVRRYINACIRANLAPKYMNTGDGWFRWDASCLFEADECAIELHGGGKLYFVFGNEPGEVLCDYSTSLDHIVAPINEWAEQWA